MGPQLLQPELPDRLQHHEARLGVCLGYQPNGRVIEISGNAVHRLANGKLIEHWAQVDMAGFMRQIGALPGEGQDRG